MSHKLKILLLRSFCCGLLSLLGRFPGSLSKLFHGGACHGYKLITTITHTAKKWMLTITVYQIGQLAGVILQIEEKLIRRLFRPINEVAGIGHALAAHAGPRPHITQAWMDVLRDVVSGFDDDDDADDDDNVGGASARVAGMALSSKSLDSALSAGMQFSDDDD